MINIEKDIKLSYERVNYATFLRKTHTEFIINKKRIKYIGKSEELNECEGILKKYNIESINSMVSDVFIHIIIGC